MIALRLILGVVFMVPAFYLGYVGTHPLNMNVLYYAGALLLIGGLIADADPVGNALKQLLQILPFFKKPPA